MRLPDTTTRLCLLVLTFLHFSFHSFAQIKEFKGYYITRQNDTIRGTFDRYKQWNYNPDKVAFTTFQNIREELTPLTCKEFYVENYDTYVTFQGKRMTNPIELSTASSMDHADTEEEVTTFLRQIAINDKYRFYVYKDQLRINLYYSDNTGEITELRQKAAIINNAFWQSMTFKQQLKPLFTDDDKTEKIDNLRYSEESLARFLNRRKGGGKYTKRIKNPNNGFFLLGGVSQNSFKFTPNRSLEYTRMNYPSKIVPLIGMGYIISINRNFGRMFFVPQLKVFSFKHSASFVYGTPYTSLYSTFQSSPVVSLGFHFGYYIINKPNLKISLMPGGGFSMLINNKQIDEARFALGYSNIVTTPMNSTTLLVDLQAMVMYRNKYILWSSYNLPTPATDLYVKNAKLTSIQLGVGYKL